MQDNNLAKIAGLLIFVAGLVLVVSSIWSLFTAGFRGANGSG